MAVIQDAKSKCNLHAMVAMNNADDKYDRQRMERVFDAWKIKYIPTSKPKKKKKKRATRL